MGIPEKITDGIYLVDTLYMGIEKFAASYIVQDNGEIVIVETNTNYAVPRILNSLKALGYDKEAVKYIILTHIHLDHAGGAGLLMDELKNAKLVVHPRGARHMISPNVLVESVKSVYGNDEYNRLYGDIKEIPEERVLSMTDGDSIEVGNRKLSMIYSPGHAKHHNVVYDDFSGSVFSGDAFGIGYPRFRYEKGDLIFPSTSPVQFDPESAINTFKLIADLKPSRILLTHFGSIENVDEAHSQLKKFINMIKESGVKRYSEGLRSDDLDKAISSDIWGIFESRIIELRGRPFTSDEKEHLFLDVDLNGKGTAVYITRKNIR